MSFSSVVEAAFFVCLVANCVHEYTMKKHIIDAYFKCLNEFW